MKYFLGALLGTLIGFMTTMSILFLAEHTKFVIFRLDWGMTSVVTGLILIFSGLAAKAVSGSWGLNSIGLSFLAVIVSVGGLLLVNSLLDDKILINLVHANPMRGVKAMACPIILTTILSSIKLKDGK